VPWRDFSIYGKPDPTPACSITIPGVISSDFNSPKKREESYALDTYPAAR